MAHITWVNCQDIIDIIIYMLIKLVCLLFIEFMEKKFHSIDVPNEVCQTNNFLTNELFKE